MSTTVKSSDYSQYYMLSRPSRPEAHCSLRSDVVAALAQALTASGPIGGGRLTDQFPTKNRWSRQRLRSAADVNGSAARPDGGTLAGGSWLAHLHDHSPPAPADSEVPAWFCARRWAAQAVRGKVVSPVVLTHRASASGAIMGAKWHWNTSHTRGGMLSRNMNCAPLSAL